MSGYGQNGPWGPLPGYASVGEAQGGFRYINGFPDASGGLSGPPVRPNISLGDTLAGMQATIGTVSALLEFEFPLTHIVNCSCSSLLYINSGQIQDPLAISSMSAFWRGNIDISI